MELLVVIAIIGILIALLLPTVQAAREPPAEPCTNNLEADGVGTAPIMIGSAFPMGTFGQWYHSWMMAILPEVEQGACSIKLVFHTVGPSDRGPRIRRSSIALDAGVRLVPVEHGGAAERPHQRGFASPREVTSALRRRTEPAIRTIRRGTSVRRGRPGLCPVNGGWFPTASCGSATSPTGQATRLPWRFRLGQDTAGLDVEIRGSADGVAGRAAALAAGPPESAACHGPEAPWCLLHDPLPST